MEPLQLIVNNINVINDTLYQIPIHKKDIYKIFIGGKHSVQINIPVPTTFNIANTACISPDAFTDYVLAHGIATIFAHDSLAGPNLVRLHGLE